MELSWHISAPCGLGVVRRAPAIAGFPPSRPAGGGRWARGGSTTAFGIGNCWQLFLVKFFKKPLPARESTCFQQEVGGGGGAWGGATPAAPGAPAGQGRGVSPGASRSPHPRPRPPVPPRPPPTADRAGSSGLGASCPPPPASPPPAGQPGAGGGEAAAAGARAAPGGWPGAAGTARIPAAAAARGPLAGEALPAPPLPGGGGRAERGSRGGADAPEDGEVPADRAALPGHRPGPGRASAGGEVPGRPARAPGPAAAARPAPPRLRGLRRLQGGEHAALLEPEGDGRRGGDLLPGLDRRAGAAGAGQGGAPGGAARGLGAPGAAAALGLPHPLPR